MTTLFDHPLAKRNDPVTSDLAAEKYASKITADKESVYEALCRHPGMTSAELAMIMGVDRYMPARRLPDLEKEGRVRKGQKRLCSACRNMAVEWWPIK